MYVFGLPSVSQGAFEFLLRRVSSPAASEAKAIYDLLLKAGIDPLFAYGQFGAESSFGSAGHAVKTLNWGNILWSSRYADYGAKPYAPGNGYTYCWFPDWTSGVRAYADLLKYYRATGSVHAVEVCRRWLGKDPTKYIANIESICAIGARRLDLSTVVTYIPQPTGAYVTIPTGTTFALDPVSLKAAFSKTLAAPMRASAKAIATITVDGKPDGKQYAHISSGTFGDKYVVVSAVEPKVDPHDATIATLQARVTELQEDVDELKTDSEALRARLSQIAALAAEEPTNG